MRLLQSYDDLDTAQGLSDELEVAGIANQVRAGDDRHGVWVINETDLETAQEVAGRFSGEASGQSRAEAERIRKKRESDARPVRLPGFGQGAGVRTGPVGQATLVLILICVAVGVLSGLGTRIAALRPFFAVPVSPDGYFYAQFDWSEPWRLLTPMFIHFGTLHLLFNMLWLYRLGSQIENLQGTRLFLGLVALTQIPGVLVQLELTGPLFGGMSGVVYGLFGYSWMQSRYSSKGYVITELDTMFIMGWFVLCATPLIGRIANAQHAFGLFFGLLAGMPAYVAFHRSSARPSFEKGSWADLNIRGFQRFKRVYFDPYVPLWFGALAVAVLFIG